MIRIAVTGSMGQVASSLVERAGREFEVVLLGRRVFLLEDRAAVVAGIRSVKPDVVINAAAYTAVDQAEAEESLALAINGEGAGHVAEAAERIGAPLLQLSTDYVFDGDARPPLPRGRSDRTAQRLRALETRRREARRRAMRKQRHPAHRLALQPLRREFPQDHAGAQRDARRDPGRRRPARQSDLGPRPRDRPARGRRAGARGRFAGAPRRLPHDRGRRGDLGRIRRGDLRRGRRRGRRQTRVKPITTAEYPRPAPRPANSRLDNAKLQHAYGLELPEWRTSLAECCARLIAPKEGPPS